MSKLIQPKSRAVGTSLAITADDSIVLDLKKPRPLGTLRVLDDEEGIQTLPLIAQVTPLRIEIDAWDEYAEDYQEMVERGYTPEVFLQVIWNGELVSSPVMKVMTKDPAEIFPIQLRVPQSLLVAEGISWVSHRQWINYVYNEFDARPVAIRVDKTAPNFGNPCPLLGPDKNVTLIDQAYLEQNNQRATFLLSRWADIRLDDRVFLYAVPVSDVGTPSEPVVVTVVDASNKPLNPFPVSIERDRLSTGRYRVFCRLMDRSGNQGPDSLILDVRVELGTGGRLPPPEVPLGFDGLVDLQDAYQPVQVRIPFIGQALPGDTLQAYWNGRPLGPVIVQANQTWPIDVPVPWSVITAEGFVGPFKRLVHYEGIRDGVAQDSPATSVMVDLRVAGPDSEGPYPENRQLKPVTVTNADGGVNELGLEDVDQPVKVHVPLYRNPIAGEVLELYWGNLGRVVATYTVKPGDVADSPVTFSDVPYGVVREAGLGEAIPVFYWTFNQVNRQRAPIRAVNVSLAPLARYQAIEGIPPYVSLFGWINCDSLYSKEKPLPPQGLPFFVPGPQDLLAAGDNVELSWQMCRDKSGLDPISPIFYFPPIPITAAGAQNGFNLYMSQIDTLIVEELKKGDNNMEGSVRVGYRVSKRDGRQRLANVEVFFVSLLSPGGARCWEQKK